MKNVEHFEQLFGPTINTNTFRGQSFLNIYALRLLLGYIYVLLIYWFFSIMKTKRFVVGLMKNSM